MNELIRSKALNNIPSKKWNLLINSIEQSTDTPQNKATKITAINRYAESNIPIEYWSLNMKDFTGDPRLKAKYEEYTGDITNSFITGKSILFAGQHGIGKTYITTSILKKACHKNFSALYINLSNIIDMLVGAPQEEKFIAKKELTMVDFLVIDEVDPRFITFEASDLFARSLESVFRIRAQNKLPILLCTNSTNVVESFNGSLKESLDSLMKGYLEVFPVFGTDFRKRNAI